MSESIFIVSLSKIYRTRRCRRVARAVKYVRDFIKRHTKAEKILVDGSIVKYMFNRKYDRPPRKIAVAVMKIDQEGKVVKASLAVQMRTSPASEGSTR